MDELQAIQGVGKLLRTSYGGLGMNPMRVLRGHQPQN